MIRRYRLGLLAKPANPFLLSPMNPTPLPLPSPPTTRPSTPPPSPRRAAWRWGLLAVLLVTLAGLALGEWLGWPMLEAPLQQALSQRLRREIKLGPPVAVVPGLGQGTASRPGSDRPFSVRFLGGIRLYAPQLLIAAPAWGSQPYLLKAQGIELDLVYADLWRAWRGQPLRIERLQADQIDAELERKADGRVSWQFNPDAPPPDPSAPPTLPAVGQMRVLQGQVHLTDAIRKLELRAQLSLSDSRLGEVLGEVVAAVPSAVPATVPAKPTSAAAANPPAPESPAGSVLRLTGTGQYRGLPLTLALTASGTLPWVQDPTLAKPLAQAVPLTLSVRVGRARLNFEGSATDALQLGGLTGRFSLQGPSLAAVGDPLGVTLPTTAAFRASGRLLRQGADWRVLVDDATVGASRLNGAFVYSGDRAVPLLAGRLGGSRLLLKDLGPALGLAPASGAAAPAVGAAPPAAEAAPPASRTAPPAARAPTPAPGVATAPQVAAASSPATNAVVKLELPMPKTVGPAMPVRRPGKVLPNRPFDLAALRVMDAQVLIDIAEVDLNTHWLEPLRPLHTRLELTGGVLTLHDLDARTAQGRLAGQVSLDGRGALALWTAALRWDGVKLERWLHLARTAGQPPWISGQLGGRARLAGEGRSTAEILASLHGTLSTELSGGSVSHLAIEAAGLDLAQALGLLVVGDDALPVGCAVADLVVDHGVFRPRVMVLDTPDSAVWVEGTLSLATEALDLRAVVSPKDFSPLALRSPLRLRGSFVNPAVSLDAGRMAPRLAVAALLALVNPLAALIPLIDTGDAEAAARVAGSCRKLMPRQPPKAPPAVAAARPAVSTGK